MRARAVVLGLPLLLAACTAAPSASPPAALPAAAPSVAGPEPAVVAVAAGDLVPVFPGPDDPVPAVVLDRRSTLSGNLAFLVLERRPDRLRVQLPGPPAGSTGWVDAGAVALSADPYSVEVRLSDRRLLLRRGPQVVLDAPVAVGATDRPTAGTPYFVTELLRPADPAGPYGPYVYALAGSAVTAQALEAGTGLVGLSGTEPDRLGTEVATGSVLLAHDVLSTLVGGIGLPLGTPVTVLP